MQSQKWLLSWVPLSWLQIAGACLLSGVQTGLNSKERKKTTQANLYRVKKMFCWANRYISFIYCKIKMMSIHVSDDVQLITCPRESLGCSCCQNIVCFWRKVDHSSWSVWPAQRLIMMMGCVTRKQLWELESFAKLFKPLELFFIFIFFTFCHSPPTDFAAVYQDFWINKYKSVHNSEKKWHIFIFSLPIQNFTDLCFTAVSVSCLFLVCINHPSVHYYYYRASC